MDTESKEHNITKVNTRLCEIFSKVKDTKILKIASGKNASMLNMRHAPWWVAYWNPHELIEFSMPYQIPDHGTALNLPSIQAFKERCEALGVTASLKQMSAHEITFTMKLAA